MAMKDFFGKHDNRQDKTEFAEEGTLHLRKEELDIDKSRVRTGEVELRKEVVEEQQRVDVPVTHEEVVIERRAVNNERSDAPVTGEGTIHIPVSEEQVRVDKHTVVTGEVSAYKREVEDRKRIEETLKREEVRVDTDGDPHIVSEKTDPHLH